MAWPMNWIKKAELREMYSEMSDTPRTDAEVERDGIPVTVGHDNGSHVSDIVLEERRYVDADFARKLERETDDLRRVADDLRKAIERLLGCPDGCRMDRFPGCAICMAPTSELLRLASLKTPPR